MHGRYIKKAKREADEALTKARAHTHKYTHAHRCDVLAQAARENLGLHNAVEEAGAEARARACECGRVRASVCVRA